MLRMAGSSEVQVLGEEGGTEVLDGIAAASWAQEAIRDPRVTACSFRALSK